MARFMAVGVVPPFFVVSLLVRNSPFNASKSDLRAAVLEPRSLFALTSSELLGNITLLAAVIFNPDYQSGSAAFEVKALREGPFDGGGKHTTGRDLDCGEDVFADKGWSTGIEFASRSSRTL